MNSTLREVSHIAKCNGNNFTLWKFGTWLLLEHYNLVGIVDGQEPYPVEVTLCPHTLSKQMFNIPTRIHSGTR